MPPLQKHERHFVRFLLKHAAIGTLSGFVFGVLLLMLDIAGLNTMIAASPDRMLFLFMLFFGLFITFGSIGIAIGVMELGEERD